MQANFRTLFTTGILLASIPCLAAGPRRPTSNTHASVRHSAVKAHKSVNPSIRQGMDSERATQIQSALIKQGYLTGEPSGTWDSESVAAMQKLQGENGWQTKITPDSRALIKLGLGPNATPQR